MADDKHRTGSDGSAAESAAPAGDVSSPLDTRGEGVVGLADRTAPGGQGAPDTNQGKTEPMPPTPGHHDPDGAGPTATAPSGAPELGAMGAGAADAQVASPSSGTAGPRHAGSAGSAGPGGAAAGIPAGAPDGPVSVGTAPADGRPAAGPSTDTGQSAVPRLAQPSGGASSHRAAGLQGEPGPQETVETDVHAGAVRMVPSGEGDAAASPPVADPGDAQGVSVPSVQAAPGTSEAAGIVQGVKAPASDPGATAPAAPVPPAGPGHPDGEVDTRTR